MIYIVVLKKGGVFEGETKRKLTASMIEHYVERDCEPEQIQSNFCILKNENLSNFEKESLFESKKIKKEMNDKNFFSKREKEILNISSSSFSERNNAVDVVETDCVPFIEPCSNKASFS